MKATTVFMLAGIILIAVSAAVADNHEGTLTLPADMPGEYVIKKGDTLWDISGHFIGDPFKWPAIWQINGYIADPHWIYPGQKLIFKKAEPPKPPKLAAPGPKFTPLSLMKKTEAKPAEASVAEAPAVNTAAIANDPNVIQALDSPRPVFTLKSFIRTGFITRPSELPRSRVAELEGGSANATTYDNLIVRTGKGARFEKGDILSVVTVEDKVKHPVTGQDLGLVVRVKGLMKVLSTDDGTARCVITENFDPVKKGDLVTAAHLRNAPLFDAWVRPDRDLSGVILARNEPILSIHLSDILYLDIGSEDGVMAGDRFAIISKEGGPDRVGELEAVNVMPGETAALVVSLTEKPVNVGDTVSLTARCRIIE